MHRPQIGISLTLDDRGRWREGRSYFYIDRSYAAAIDRAGGAAIQLPIQTQPEDLISGLDGLLIPGGDDFPSEVGSAIDASLDLAATEQIAFDESLLEAATRAGIPVLGICYGMQLMARATGGVLDAHLPSDRPEVDDHRLAPDERHPISIEGDSLLSTIIGCRDIDVNSLHHQAIRRVGSTYRVVARSADGVVEAIELPGETRAPTEDRVAWHLGVQWHPEKLEDDASDRLFRAFVEACRSHACGS